MEKIKNIKSLEFEKNRKKLIENIINERGYIYCQFCGRSDAYRYDPHHIIFRSELGKSKDIHNLRNLICLCENCHIKFHTTKRMREPLIKERDLNTLYGRTFY